MSESTNTLVLSGYSAKRDLLVTRFHRGVRSVYTIPLPLHLIPSHLPKPDPEQPFEGNRTVDAAHARGFARYWREREDWSAPPVLLDTNAELNFEAKFSAGGVDTGVLSLPHNSAGTLAILDGQHRVLGWYMAIEGVAADLKAAREELQKSKRAQDEVGQSVWRDKIGALEALERRLEQEYVTMELVEGVTAEEHKQAFADITVNARGITKSKTVEFDSVSVINRVTRELAETHPLLVGRVDFENDRVSGRNPNYLSARNVADIVRHVALGISGRMNERREKEYRDERLLKLATTFLDSLVSAFPDLADVAAGDVAPEALRKDSLLGSPTIIRVLAGAFYQLAVVVDRDIPALDRDGVELAEALFASLTDMAAPVMPGTAWYERTGVFPEEGGMAPSSRSQDLKHLTDVLAAWGRDPGSMPQW